MDRRRTRLFAAVWAAGLTSLTLPAAAFAAEAADAQTGIAELVVTAQKRSENIQDVPISIVAVSGETLQKAGLTDFQNLTSLAPGLVTDANSDARSSRIGLRGVTTAQDNGKTSSVGVFVDGVYMSRVGMAFTELADIDHIEVLRGPQGTLFGMNTSAGLIHIITKRPSLTDVSGFVEGVAGNYDRKEVRGSISGPIVADKLAGSFSAYATDRGGTVYNITQGKDVNDQSRWGLRGKLRYAQGNLDLQVIADYTNENSNCCGNVLLTLKPTAMTIGQPVIPLATAAGAFPYSRIKLTGLHDYVKPQGAGLSAEANYDLGFATLTSLTAWREWNIRVQNDAGGLAIPIIETYGIQRHDQYSQEFRLASNGEGKLQWVGGLFFFRRDSDAVGVTRFVPLLYHTAAQDGLTVDTYTLKDISKAAFGQVSYQVTDAFKLAVGARYSRENQDAHDVQVARNAVSPNYNRTESRNEGQATYTVTGTYDFSPAVMAYASVARGFKPGGFDMGRPATFTNFQFDEETNLNTEVGFRSTLMERRLLLNATLFNTVYKNFQTVQYDGIRFLSGNAPKFTTKGLELEVMARPAAGLSISGNAAFISAKYNDFKLGACPQGVAGACDLTGRTLPQAPKTTYNVAVDYEHPLAETSWTGFVHADYAYRSKAYFNQALDANLVQKAYGLANLRIGVTNGDGLKIEGFATNLFDKDYMSFAFNAPLMSGGAYEGFLGDPRMYGVRVRKEF
jgi:iron complex outermembrane receptor protein